MKKIIGDGIKKHKFVYNVYKGLLVLILGLIIIPNIYANGDSEFDTIAIVNQYTTITVSGFNLIDTVHLEIINPYDYDKKINISIQIPWVYSRG
ncbi:MAG: hypothetical protein DRN07_02875, partial [Thermoplasmata archaeon]